MNNTKLPIAWLVVPCYNEEEALPKTGPVFDNKWKTLIERGVIDPKSRILFVDDGSKDKTREVITRLHEESPRIDGAFLTRNRGHQNALLAGLMTAMEFCDCAISIDADLQDDIDAIDGMLEAFENGADVVYGVRSKRETDTVFKRVTAEGYYKVLKKLGADIVYNHADYRLMSKRALEGLAEYGEVNLFLRGLVPMVGYKSDIVEYERSKRVAGESKYPLKKMLAFAFEGVTSLSTKPIRWITKLGVFILFVSFVMLIYTLVRYFTGQTVPGWASLNISIWAVGGLILFSLGVVGEYVGKTYLETKKRPRFRLEKVLLHDGETEED